MALTIGAPRAITTPGATPGSTNITLGGGQPTHAPAASAPAPMQDAAGGAATALRAASTAAVTSGNDLTALTQALTGLTQVLQGLASKLAGAAKAAPAAPPAAAAPATPALGGPPAPKAGDDAAADKAPKDDKKPEPPKDEKKADDKPAPKGADGDRAKIVAAAQKEVAKNITENAGEDEDKGGQIAKYREATGPKRGPEAWCADFTSFVFQQAGVKLGKDGKGSPAVNVIKDWAKSTNKWKTNDPKPGDAIVFNWAGNKTAKGDHIGVVEKVENGKVYTIEGNSGDKLQRREYTLDAKAIQGYVNAV